MKRAIGAPADTVRLWGWTLVVTLVGMAGPATSARAFNIAATFDTSITNHPQAATIMATINAAIAQYPNRILDPVTVNITFKRMKKGLGASTTYYQKVLYSDYLTAVRNHAASFDDAVALTHLPDGPPNPANGNDTLFVYNGLRRALGLSSVPQTRPLVAVTILNPARGDPQATRAVREQVRRLVLAEATAPAAVQAGADGIISLYLDLMNLTTNPTPADKYSLFSVVSHEIDEVLGSSSGLNGVNNGDPVPGGPAGVEDLYRYDDAGARTFLTGSSDLAYLSYDGTTLLARFNQSQGGDFSDWWSPPGHTPVRVQDASGTLGADPVMGVEWRMLDGLGWNYVPTATWVELGYGGTETGAYESPYSTLSGGIAATASGAMTFIKAGTNGTGPITVSQPATITAVGGSVTFGN